MWHVLRSVTNWTGNVRASKLIQTYNAVPLTPLHSSPKNQSFSLYSWASHHQTIEPIKPSNHQTIEPSNYGIIVVEKQLSNDELLSSHRCSPLQTNRVFLFWAMALKRVGGKVCTHALRTPDSTATASATRNPTFRHNNNNNNNNDQKHSEWQRYHHQNDSIALVLSVIYLHYHSHTRLRPLSPLEII